MYFLPGRTLCPVAVDLFDGQGRLVAVAQVTYILLNHDSNAISESTA